MRHIELDDGMVAVVTRPVDRKDVKCPVDRDGYKAKNRANVSVHSLLNDIFGAEFIL